MCFNILSPILGFQNGGDRKGAARTCAHRLDTGIKNHLPAMEGGFFVVGRIIDSVEVVGSKSNPPYRLDHRHLDFLSFAGILMWPG